MSKINIDRIKKEINCNSQEKTDMADRIFNEELGIETTQSLISKICDEIKEVLISKNRKYGDSAINPIRVFSKASNIEQINVRIDDKISRIISSQEDDTEDSELDLIGYLILKRVALAREPETIINIK